MKEQMIKKEQKYSAKKSPAILERHNQITEEMRAILFDWMMEVCYEMGFLRMTFHLSVEILDRFLANTTNFRRDRLQVRFFFSLHWGTVNCKKVFDGESIK